MNKIILSIILALALVSCASDLSISEIEPLTPDYELPQGKSPADSRIVELYKKYGTYVLYEFPEKDFNWKLIDTSLGEPETPPVTYSYKPADPAYAGDILDLLEKSWFRFCKDEFLKKYFHQKVFLVSALQQGEMDEEDEYRFIDFLIETHHMVISNCSEKIRDKSDYEMRELRISLQESLLNSWMYDKIGEAPNDFFKVSSYTSHAIDYDPDSEDFTRTRGFIFADKYGYEWSTYLMGADFPEYSKWDMDQDLYHYIYALITRTSAEWADDLTYPLVKEKYDILIKFFLEKYGLDIQAMGNADYN